VLIVTLSRERKRIRDDKMLSMWTVLLARVMNVPVLQRVMAVTISHAKTVSITLTRRRKVMSVKALAISCWLVVASILGLVCFLTAGVSEGSESEHTGHIKEDTRICEFDAITPDNVDILERYQSIINKLEEVGIDGLTQLDRQIGYFLTNQVGCGTVAKDYRIILFLVEGDYVIFLFDPGYGFESLKQLMRLSDFHADEIL